MVQRDETEQICCLLMNQKGDMNNLFATTHFIIPRRYSKNMYTLKYIPRKLRKVQWSIKIQPTARSITDIFVYIELYTKNGRKL